jgi:hypothetical protein
MMNVSTQIKTDFRCTLSRVQFELRGSVHSWLGRPLSSSVQDGKAMGSELDAILDDAQQCLGLVPRDVPTARIFVQGLVGVRSHPEPREVFLRVQHLNLQIKSVR